MQMDRVYLSSPNVIAVLDHEKKRTFVMRKDGLPDVGKMYSLVKFQKHHQLIVLGGTYLGLPAYSCCPQFKDVYLFQIVWSTGHVLDEPQDQSFTDLMMSSI